MTCFQMLLDAVPTPLQVKDNLVWFYTVLYNDVSQITCRDVMKFFGEMLFGMILHWILLLPLLAYTMVFYWRHLCDTRKHKNIVKWFCPHLKSSKHFLPGSGVTKLRIVFMSGRVLDIEANSFWSVRDLKNEICRLEEISVFQMRMYVGCDELRDDMFLSESGSTQFTLVLRSVECGKWLEHLSKGTACDLKDACDEVRSSKECVLAAVRLHSWQSLKHSPEFQDDEDVAMAAVYNDGFALVNVSARLRTKPQVALAAISRDRESMSMKTLEPLRSDKEFLRRAYWVSTLDCKEDQRLRQEDIGPFETWDDILFKHHVCLQRIFWRALHNELRKNRLAHNVFSTVAPLLYPLLVHAIANTSSFPWWKLCMFSYIPCIGSFYLLEPGFHEMHVEFVKWIAGPLENPRRSCCRCCQ